MATKFKPCLIADCNLNADRSENGKRGWCRKHYSRWLKYGDPLKGRVACLPVISDVCSVDGCDKPRDRRGLCRAHYFRNLRHGDPTKGRTSRGAPLRWLELHVGHEGVECLIWPFARGETGGDGVVTFRGRQTSANFVMCVLAHGEPPTLKHESAHSCGRGHDACVHPKHLRWATRKQNHADKLIHGTHSRGEQSWSAKVTIAQVREIRKLRGEVGQKELGERFGITKGAVHSIQIRKNWAWLP